MTLLTSVTKGDTPENRQYHFVFPFARYDLVNYWDHNRSPSWDKTTVRWVANQLLGIMGAMDAIHVPKHLHLSTQIAKYGMHGDLKPDNILWFESHKDDRGIFVISDFGVADMHSDKSRSNIPNEKIPAVPGYRPPECDIQNGYISRRYDIWTLGCLFLEILTWLMGGQELVSTFKKERMKTIYVTGAKRDMFYTVKKLEGQKQGAIHLRESIIAVSPMSFCSSTSELKSVRTPAHIYDSAETHRKGMVCARGQTRGQASTVPRPALLWDPHHYLS